MVTAVRIIPGGSLFELLLFALSNIIIAVLYQLVMRTIEMEYMTANQAAHKWDISQRRVQILCAEGRIPGVFKLGETWAIPVDSAKPRDQRRKGGNNNEEL